LWCRGFRDTDRAVDGPDFQHSPRKIALGASQSNDATRILPPTSRLIASVVLPVVPNFSRAFSTKNPQVYSNYCFSVMLVSALRASIPVTRLAAVAASRCLRRERD
jgi:hypothetical protein